MKVFLIICLFLPLLSFASPPQSFKLKNGTVTFVVPEKWENVRKLFGIQLMLAGPIQGSNRPIITVESTEFSEFSFDSEALKKNENSYKEGRTKWLSKYDGEVKEFFPYEVKKLAKGTLEDHVLGFHYKLGEAEFSERSHFIKCKKNLYHLKVLLLSSEEAQYKEGIEKLFESFSCKEV